jgi:demethylmenaquinone methyltransferase/2-methoxy-6-polyprenyl-1,4-benzoquinol methylase
MPVFHISTRRRNQYLHPLTLLLQVAGILITIHPILEHRTAIGGCGCGPEPEGEAPGMVDHFHILAPLYDRLMGPPDAAHLAGLLNLPAAGGLLDCGGGTGRASWPLRRWVGRLVVCDLCERMLARARNRNLNAVRARAEQLPFPDEAFERILVVDALHHFSDPAAAIADFARVLRPGGRIVVEEFDADRKVVRWIALAENIARMHSRFLPPRDIRDLMRACGLKSHVDIGRRLAAWIVGDKP